MKIHWVHLTDNVGIGMGYSQHQQFLHRALANIGAELDEQGEVAVHLTTPTFFTPIPDKINVLFTMYECTTLPEDWVPHLHRADLIVVPCTHNAWLFSQYTDVPVVATHEGVDASVYHHIARSFPAERPFCFLWIGASNPRKGVRYVANAWELWNIKHPELAPKTMLVMKTTQQTNPTATIHLRYHQPSIQVVDSAGRAHTIERDGQTEKIVRELPRERVMQVAGNAIVDTRRLPLLPEGEMPDPNRFYGTYLPGSLMEVYNFAHAFLLPSMGEGWGLTLCEAAATGLPCVYTDWSGPRDFMSRETGYPVRWRFRDVEGIKLNAAGENEIYHRSQAASPDVHHIVRRMEQIYYGYQRALERGKRASDNILARFTWDKAAADLVRILERETPRLEPKTRSAAVSYARRRR